MAGKMIVEIIFLWFLFALYMAILVVGKGPIGAIYFYPSEVQERVVELKLIDKKTIQRRRRAAYLMLLLGIIIVYYILIVVMNQADDFWNIAWQVYVLFIGMELFDLFAVDVYWVALTKWWDIPGTEDLQHLYHNPIKKIKVKSVKLLVLGIPIAAIMAGLYLFVLSIW